MLEYARWKYYLIVAVIIVCALFALPTVFGEDPALQIVRRDHNPITTATEQTFEQYLTSHGVQFTKTSLDGGQLMIRFSSVPEQLKARDAVSDKFSDQYIAALSFAPRTPAFLRAMGLKPMKLGLDLRGGLDLLYQVDVQASVQQLLEGYAQDVRRALTSANIPFTEARLIAAQGSDQQNAVRITLPANADAGKVRDLVAKTVPDFVVSVTSLPGGTAIDGVLPPAKIRDREDYAIQQNLVTLRNRVNELGVSEPIVERQGLDRIDVQLPGVTNSAEVKNILGKVATLEFRMVDETDNPIQAAQTGEVPPGTKLYTNTIDGQPILLKREIIATGDELTSASFSMGQEGPQVNIRLDSRAGERMLQNTRRNIGKQMGIVYIEKRRETKTVDGKKVTRDVTEEKVINHATIQGVFSNTFMITGLNPGEGRDLALEIRSGSLSVPISEVSERAIGPSLGQDNIDKGIAALVIGMAGVFIFMAIYYRVFGLVADAVLAANVIVLAGLLSMFGSVLSLPGIAGIILTVGMAVDANVLIYERIREELRNGVTPQAAIRAGFEKAFSAIADSNVTTLIAGVVLWVLGTGAIRGFAVVLTLGIATSMFTSLMGSRALVTLLYGGRRKIARLPI
ncbi:MAG TPA: protein translocase subunit SecD [Steroidobacteraceae bacterium]|nr:protein translocase subunit SecD [Steroidobacteraceae bacterium]